MECMTYLVSHVAYPRFDYALRQYSSFVTRVNALFKTLEFESQTETPDFYSAEIHVISLCPALINIDKLAVQQKPTDKVGIQPIRKIEDVGTFLTETPLDEKKPTLLVLSLDKVPDDIEKLKDSLKSIVFVTQNVELETAIKQKVGGENERDVLVTTKLELGKAVGFSLERVVFRNITSLTQVLRPLNETVSKHGDVEKPMEECVNLLMKSFANARFMKALEKEFIVQYPQLKRHLEATVKQNPTDQETELEPNPELDVPVEVPDYLKDIPDISEKHTIGRCLWYFQIYKMSEHLANSVGQKIDSIYKEIPPAVRERLPSSARPTANIVSSIQSELRAQFPKQLDEILVSIELTEGRFGTTDALLKMLRSKKKELFEMVCGRVCAIPVFQQLDKHVKLVKSQKNGIADLVGEVTGMYNRSKVPQHERPISPVSHGKLSEKVANSLFESIKEIKGCGYRYNKLTIFLEKESDQDTVTAEGKIKHILGKHGIYDYDITPAMKSMKHFKQVGAKIRVRRSGTLGGFAVMKQPKEDVLCALVSMHVVNGGGDLVWVENEQTGVKIGSMIQAEGEGESVGLIDVAAAKIFEDKVKICDTSFKDSLGLRLPSSLFETDEVDYLEGMHVHIYGASTPLGKGIITMPRYFANEPAEPDEIRPGLFIIEDIDEGEDGIQRFSKEGDSGAIICADDPDGESVLVLAMLIGCINYQNMNGDPSIKGKYLTFRMTSAFKKLTNETGHTFQLCC